MSDLKHVMFPLSADANAYGAHHIACAQTSSLSACEPHMPADCFFAGAGASIAERTSPAACATTDHMSREQAMEALTQVAASRQPVKDAVYQYWLDKRKQLGKPLLRRLQAPTNSSDTNPHSCFR